MLHQRIAKDYGLWLTALLLLSLSGGCAQQPETGYVKQWIATQDYTAQQFVNDFIDLESLHRVDRKIDRFSLEGLNQSEGERYKNLTQGLDQMGADAAVKVNYPNGVLFHLRTSGYFGYGAMEGAFFSLDGSSLVVEEGWCAKRVDENWFIVLSNSEEAPQC